MTTLTDPLGLVVVRWTCEQRDELYSLVLEKALCGGDRLSVEANVPRVTMGPVEEQQAVHGDDRTAVNDADDDRPPDEAEVVRWLHRRFDAPWTEVVRVVALAYDGLPDRLLAEDADACQQLVDDRPESDGGRLGRVEEVRENDDLTGYRIKLDDPPDGLAPGYGPLLPVLTAARAAGCTHVRLDPDGD